MKNQKGKNEILEEKGKKKWKRKLNGKNTSLETDMGLHRAEAVAIVGGRERGGEGCGVSGRAESLNRREKRQNLKP